MAPQTPWKELVPGIIAFLAIVAIGAGVLVFAGLGRIHGDTMRLYVATNQARGVMQGTEVWVSGQKIGRVDRVGFKPASADSAHRVVIALTVREKDAEQIRRDSEVQVRAGSNIIGPMVIYMSPGSPNGARVADGDTIRVGPQADREVAGVKLEEAMAEVGPLMTDAKTVIAHVRNPNGTVGAALQEKGGGSIASLRAQVTRLKTRMARRGGPGPADVMQRASVAMARVDSIRALLESPNSSYGRFRRDSSLTRAVAEVRDELSELRAQLAESNGTVPRFSSDSAITVSIAAAQREMALLFEDIRKRPLRYIAF